MSEAASEPSPSELVAKLDELTRELRRQGRAAVAAQAAAESCLDVLGELREERSPRASVRDEHPPGADTPTATTWLRSIVPVADALERVVTEAEALTERRSKPEPRRLWPFGRARSGAPDEELVVLREGLRALRAQLEGALAGLGVTVDSRTQVPLDPDVHRVVEVRRGAAPGQVLEVVRAGYALAGRTVREAEVIVGDEGKKSKRRRDDEA